MKPYMVCLYIYICVTCSVCVCVQLSCTSHTCWKYRAGSHRRATRTSSSPASTTRSPPSRQPPSGSSVSQRVTVWCVVSCRVSKVMATAFRQLGESTCNCVVCGVVSCV